MLLHKLQSAEKQKQYCGQVYTRSMRCPTDNPCKGAKSQPGHEYTLTAWVTKQVHSTTDAKSPPLSNYLQNYDNFNPEFSPIIPQKVTTQSEVLGRARRLTWQRNFKQAPRVLMEFTGEGKCTANK